jgi:hypothetical protein
MATPAFSKDVFNKKNTVLNWNNHSNNWIIQLQTLPVLHFNCCFSTEYSETTAQSNGNFDTDNQMYIL